jgi:hypothetical protein
MAYGLYRIQYFVLLGVSKKVIRPYGKLIMVIGGELSQEYVKAVLFQNGVLKIEAQNLRTKTVLNLHLINAQIEKIAD